jgi:hypothetical protein
MSNDVVKNESILYNGPPPSPGVINAPPTLPISLLVRSIIDLSDRLFFISHSLGNPSIRGWRLVRVNLPDNTSISPSCLQDGRFLLEFFTLHYNDVRFNGKNQRNWLQYHSIGDIAMPTSSTTTHLIRLSDSLEALAAKNHLVPFRRLLNLTHSDTYLHGPFEFASVNGRKTQDHIAKPDWDALACQASRFQNSLPLLDLPSYSISTGYFGSRWF